ncbi:uncharacterized protein LOC110989281 [Acanthaster planci]|uniref:Uncharacterized protein LOC110989281 n=1 Tax=Acanthaster planci TaxID=133434 RepID=A0A8B7ZVX9_ACAPL|nr:uncharacterized protein LOC110989281 [Acanthaster planci]
MAISDKLKKGSTSDFPSGFDRWLALQSVSDKILRRASTLNAMEKLRLERATKQIEFKIQLRESHYDTVNQRLKETLKDHDLYKRALLRNAEPFRDNHPIPPTAEMKPFGRYQGQYHSKMGKAMQKEEDEIAQRRLRKRNKLLEKAKQESETLIDPKLTTEQLLSNKDKPLSERFKRSAGMRLATLRAQTNALNAFMKVKRDINIKKEARKHGKTGLFKGVFQTEDPR